MAFLGRGCHGDHCHGDMVITDHGWRKFGSSQKAQTLPPLWEGTTATSTSALKVTVLSQQHTTALAVAQD